MRWHLIPTIATEQPVLPAVGLLSLLEDVRDQLLIGPVRAARRVRAIFVPSIEITPTSTKPASSHNANTAQNSSPSARS